MFRRKFLQLMTFTSASNLVAFEALAAGPAVTIAYRVKGFSCVTCAIGLDTMLGRQKGVISSKSTYPEGIVKVSFNPDQITEQKIEAFIADLGFTVASRLKAE
jgi:copper chaperone CopZ